jgi:hypothetical protein
VGGDVLEQIVVRLELPWDRPVALSRCVRCISHFMLTTSDVDTFAKLMSRFYLRIELRLEFQDKDIFSYPELLTKDM